MKKLALSVLAIAGFAMSTQAQVRPHALGLRISEGTSSGIEASYQHGLNSKNRLEFDGGAFSDNIYDRVSLVGMYHWVWNLKGGLNWYIGPGAGLSLNRNPADKTTFRLALGGQIGLEYDLNKQKIPLLVSVDARPLYDLLGEKSFGWGAALGVRYTWGKSAKK
ncbi:MAG: hypothetical protein ACR2IL_10315 [Chitinophagaceae bacterium]